MVVGIQDVDDAIGIKAQKVEELDGHIATLQAKVDKEGEMDQYGHLTAQAYNLRVFLKKRRTMGDPLLLY